jgi:hypothetical protein
MRTSSTLSPQISPSVIVDVNATEYFTRRMNGMSAQSINDCAHSTGTATTARRSRLGISSSTASERAQFSKGSDQPSYVQSSRNRVSVLRMFQQ